MGPLDALWHLLNFLAPAVGLGVISASLTKLFWRQQLKTVRWRSLAAWASGGAVLALVGGLLAHGQDGRISTYGAMVLATALALLWAGWGPRRG